MTIDPAVLLAATADRLHQPYRASTMPESTALISQLRRAGIPAVISGAGPSVLALPVSPGSQAEAIMLAPPGWRTEAPGVDHIGAEVVRSSP